MARPIHPSTLLWGAFLALSAKGAPVLELTLAEPVRVAGMLGPGRPTQRLLVSVDDPAAFRAALGA